MPSLNKATEEALIRWKLWRNGQPLEVVYPDEPDDAARHAALDADAYALADAWLTPQAPVI